MKSCTFRAMRNSDKHNKKHRQNNPQINKPINFRKTTISGKINTELAVLRVKSNNNRTIRKVKPLGLPINTRNQLKMAIRTLRNYTKNYWDYM